MASNGIVCVVNRTRMPLQYIKGGQQFVLEPGENHILASHVKFAVTQNPLMGSENPRNPAEFVSLVGVKNLKANKRHNDCSAIEFVLGQDKRSVTALFENGRPEQPVTVERIDRSKLSPKRRKAVVEEADIPISRYFLAEGGEGGGGNSENALFPGADA